MNLQTRINQDLKEALRRKEGLAVSVLRMLNSAIHNKEIEKRTKLSKAEQDIKKLEELSRLSEEEVLQIVLSEAKKRKEAIIEFEKGNRKDLTEKEKKELEILKKYLPEQMSEAEIKEIVQKVIKEAGAVGQKDIGRVMSVLMPKLKGKAEGGTISRIVNELLKKE